MNVSFHLHFNGQCQEAFKYYEEVLGGKIGTMLSFGDSPHAENVPSEWLEKIVHANINVAGVELAGDDLQSEEYEQPKGFYILLGIETEERTKSIFDSLSKNGSILFPLQKTFWSPCYGIVVDQYGTPWKLNCVT